MKLFILAAMAMVAAASIESNIQELDLSFLMKDFPSLYPAKKPTTPKPEPKKKFRPFLDMFPDRSKLQIPKLKPDEDVGKALILTPMIKAGKIAEAVKQSKVEGLFPGVESHSGFFQIDPKADANLFFWYFPAENRKPDAPTIIWLQGGPGGSSLFGLFLENGPFAVDSKGQLTRRNTTWSKEANLLYFDQPIGTGFSNVKNPARMCADQKCVSDDMYEALQQFYTMFPNLLKNELFITGESYAGKYVPAISHKIHVENSKMDGGNVSTTALRLPLKGLAIGDGLTDPLNQLYMADFYYQTGLLDEHQDLEIATDAKDARDCIKRKDWGDAASSFNDALSSFLTYSDLDFIYNYLLDGEPSDFDNHIRYVEAAKTRKALHVGNTFFADTSEAVYDAMENDIPKSVAPELEDLLNAKYRVLIYSGQLDLIIPYTGTANYISKLNWYGAEKYKYAERVTWRMEDRRVAGYAREVNKHFTQLFVRNAGHILPYDQPEFGMDMITRFIKGESFRS